MISTLIQTLCLASVALPAAAEGVFQDVSIYDALAQARRDRRVVLVAWTRPNDPQCNRMGQIWADPEVAGWVKQHAVAVQIDGEKERRQAQNWGIAEYPTTVLLKPDGRALLRTVGFRSAADFLLEADAAYQANRAGEQDELTEPSGDDAESPEAWLGYANALFAKNDGDPAVCLNAYLWCLDNGDVHSPGFLDTHLDLILRRVVGMDRMTGSRSQLRTRGEQYTRAMAEGYGTASSLRTIIAISNHLREPRTAVQAYEIITGAKDPNPELVQIALDGVIGTLVAHKRYNEALEHAGDVVARVRADAARLEQTMDGKTPGAGAAATMEAKREFVDRSGLYYEALLGVGRGADAKELAGVVLDTIPTGNACATLIGHAKRLELTTVAESLAAAGLEQVRSAKGKKQIERALTAGKVGFRPATSKDLGREQAREAEKKTDDE